MCDAHKLTEEQEILRLAIKRRDMLMGFPTNILIANNTKLGRKKIRPLIESMVRDGLLREAPYRPRNKRILEVTEKGETEVKGLEL